MHRSSADNIMELGDLHNQYEPRGGSSASSNRRKTEPLPPSTLNLFACIIASAALTIAVVGLAIAFFILAFS
ncbi:unnamed protein product [Caenorhabditis auriculariae]|uniref:Uncharacterized protein n=1 Tax=Caenorhabditis auriculariae TaxID=2777116 RepID=A0A8S1GVL2_9PELO|nr:unnamed protein product [Caenorhabditis auriculariae]